LMHFSMVFFLFLLNYSTLRIKNVKNNGKIFQCWRETKLKENKQNILSPSTPTNKMTALIFRWNCCCP
jgi:protein associated with RNAse G/E